VPPGEPGPRMVSIEDAGGAASIRNAFTYFGLPSLGTLTPRTGILAGGITVSIVGDYFTQDTEVFFGTRPLEDAAVTGRVLILGTLPPGVGVGPVDLVIRSRFGESRFPGAFTYEEPPVLESLEPSWGLLAGGESFVLKGRFFPEDGRDLRIFFGSAEVIPFTVRSASEITGMVPPAAAPGSADVRVSSSLGTAVLPGGFIYFETAPALFVRGDGNLDGRIDITDAIAALEFLFLGGSGLACLDAADGNDDGLLDISDPVGILGFLFLGGPPPAPPYPKPGPDPTGDSLGCEGSNGL